MINSILTSVKKNLGIEEDYTVFDHDIITHINTVFLTLNQLGVGPTEGFAITDKEAEWVDFMGTDPRLNAVKTYMYLCVRFVFDPPETSYLIQAQQKQIEMLEWRLNVHREDTEWTDPDNPEELP